MDCNSKCKKCKGMILLEAMPDHTRPGREARAQPNLPECGARSGREMRHDGLAAIPACRGWNVEYNYAGNNQFPAAGLSPAGNAALPAAGGERGETAEKRRVLPQMKTDGHR
jgi:hypothetical protein